MIIRRRCRQNQRRHDTPGKRLQTITIRWLNKMVHQNILRQIENLPMKAFTTFPVNILTRESHLEQISIPKPFPQISILIQRLIISTVIIKKSKQNPERPRNLATNPTLTIPCLGTRERHRRPIMASRRHKTISIILRISNRNILKAKNQLTIMNSHCHVTQEKIRRQITRQCRQGRILRQQISTTMECR